MHRSSALGVDADINCGASATTNIDLSCDRIQFSVPADINRQASGDALDLGQTSRGYWRADMGYD